MYNPRAVRARGVGPGQWDHGEAHPLARPDLKLRLRADLTLRTISALSLQPHDSVHGVLHAGRGNCL